GFHCFPFHAFGDFIGVDILFVISGFLISGIIFGNLGRDNFSFAGFYSRRIKRIFPALLVVLIASYAIGWCALLSDEYKQLGKHVFAAVDRGASAVAADAWRVGYARHRRWCGAVSIRPRLDPTCFCTVTQSCYTTKIRRVLRH
ncbi:MAG: acyltransferase family protein, partial [Pseudolabrys sp.]